MKGACEKDPCLRPRAKKGGWAHVVLGMTKAGGEQGGIASHSRKGRVRQPELAAVS